MSLDPTEDEIKKFDTITKVATWVALPGTIDDESTPLGSLFALLGAEPNQGTLAGAVACGQA